MAPPPKYLIERRLVKSVCKNFAPTMPIVNREYFTQVLNCWRVNGIGSKKCIEQEQMFDFAMHEVKTFKKRMSLLNLRRMVMTSMKNPVFPDVKGRHTSFRKRHADMIKFADMI